MRVAMLLHGDTKPRTYGEIVRKYFLNTAKKKAKTKKEIYRANGRQLRFLRRNLAHIANAIESVCYFYTKAQRAKIFDGSTHCL